MATKNYFVGPQDKWVKVIAAGSSFSTRIGGIPHTHPFYVFGDPTATPGVGDTGILICHKPFKTENSGTGSTGNKDAFWVRVPGNVPNSKQADGRLRIDVYTDNGTLV